MMKNNKMLHMVTFLLLVIGGLNWLLMGIFGWDVGSQFLGGSDAMASKILYILVGLSAVLILVMHKGDCKTCGGGGAMQK